MAKKISWIGNKHKRELHRVDRDKLQPNGCQLDEVPDEHRKEFRIAREALNAGYDACAYCTKRFKSRR
jgi:hypothetical protein